MEICVSYCVLWLPQMGTTNNMYRVKGVTSVTSLIINYLTRYTKCYKKFSSVTLLVANDLKCYINIIGFVEMGIHDEQAACGEFFVHARFLFRQFSARMAQRSWSRHRPRIFTKRGE